MATTSRKTEASHILFFWHQISVALKETPVQAYPILEKLRDKMVFELDNFSNEKAKRRGKIKPALFGKWQHVTQAFLLFHTRLSAQYTKKCIRVSLLTHRGYIQVKNKKSTSHYSIARLDAQFHSTRPLSHLYPAQYRPDPKKCKLVKNNTKKKENSSVFTGMNFTLKHTCTFASKKKCFKRKQRKCSYHRIWFERKISNQGIKHTRPH